MLDRAVGRWRSRGPGHLPTPPGLGEVAVEAHGVTVVRGGRPIVDRVDLAVRHGELVILVGPNGAGKSTLLGALAGDIVPEHGHAALDGRAIAAWGVRDLAMRRSVLLQRIEISFPFRVHEVVRMGRAPWAGTQREMDDDQAVMDAMGATDVGALADREYPSLSGGERARAALARVLAQEAGVLLLDEPTGALDLHHQELVMGLARQRATRGDAVVVVAHDLAMAAAWADRIVVLEHGRVAAEGAPRDVLTAELLSRVYHHEVEVLSHPRTGLPLVIPRR